MAFTTKYLVRITNVDSGFIRFAGNHELQDANIAKGQLRVIEEHEWTSDSFWLNSGGERLYAHKLEVDYSILRELPHA